MRAHAELWARLPPRARFAAAWLGAGAAYLATRAFIAHGVVGERTDLLWPALGIAFIAGLEGGPLLGTAPAVGALVQALATGSSPAAAAALGAGVLATAVTAAVAARAYCPVGAGESVRDFVARTGAAVAAALMAAACFRIVIDVNGVDLAAGPPRGIGFLIVTNLAGILVLGSLVRAWLHPTWPGVAGRLERVGLLAAAAGLAVFVNTDAFGDFGPTPYVLLCVVFWAALRAGRRGTTTVVAVVSSISGAYAAHGHGAFAGATDSATALSLSAFLIVLAASGLGFASLSVASATAQAQLREREQRYRALIENATDVVTVLAPDGRVLYESPSSLHVLGRHPDAVVGTNLLDHLHPGDVERARLALRRVSGRPDPVSVALRRRHADGRWIDVVSTARDLTADPAVGGIVVNSHDVSESVRAERERREAERRYRDLVERLPLVTYVRGASPEEPPQYVSPQIEELLGYPLRAWYTDPDLGRRVVDERDLPLFEEMTAADGDSRRGEYRMTAADGRVVWVLDHYVTLRDEAGEPVGEQGFLVDITRQKALEEQLRQAQRIEALGLLAGGVAHDFNNLLMAISGYTELAESHADDADRSRRDLREVAHATERAADLTRQLLAFARRQSLEQAIVDVNAVVRDAAPLLTRLLGADVELTTRLDDGIGAIRGDGGQLTQVLLNLAVNARDAMPRGGALTIATTAERLPATPRRPSGDYTVLTVSDTGEGIDAAAREHLFEPFFTTKGVGRGTGLGLAMVHGIVEQMGGTISVDSRPGEGASFRIALPRVAEQPQPAEVATEAVVGRNETILLVEDEDVVRRLTEEMLEGLGYRVVTVASPREALDLHTHWDLLLTDVMMPGMSGRELAAMLRRQRPGVPVVFVSGYAGPGGDDDLGAELLAKPYTLAELGRALRAALDARTDAAAA
jgi:PAS domain S-box-containing protein